jgi:hypothetical protein
MKTFASRSFLRRNVQKDLSQWQVSPPPVLAKFTSPDVSSGYLKCSNALKEIL